MHAAGEKLTRCPTRALHAVGGKVYQMTRKRPSAGLQWAKKGQKCDVSRKICPSLFFAAARTAGKAPGVSKRFLMAGPSASLARSAAHQTPYTGLAACGRLVLVRMAGKSSSMGLQTRARGARLHFTLAFSAPAYFCRGSDRRERPFCQCQARISGPLSFLRGLGPRGGYVLAAFAAPLPLSHSVCHIAGKVSFFGRVFRRSLRRTLM